MTNIEDQSREQIITFLPDALKKAITSYQSYMDSKDSTDTDDFKDMHVTGKAAIAHIELLLKLARWADMPSKESNNDQVILAAMMEAAEEELAGHMNRPTSINEG